MQGKEVKRAMKNGQGKEAKGKRRKEGRRRRQCSCSSPPPSPRIKAAGRFSFYSCTGEQLQFDLASSFSSIGSFILIYVCNFLVLGSPLVLVL